jgi:hypothetical protein
MSKLFTMTMEEELYEELKAQALSRRSTMSAYVRRILWRHIDQLAAAGAEQQMGASSIPAIKPGTNPVDPVTNRLRVFDD